MFEERLISFLKWIGLLLVTLLFFGAFYSDAVDSYRLSNHGKEAVATIISYDPEFGRRGRYHYNHTLEYDGHEKQIDMGDRYEIGSRFDVLYLPNKPYIVKFGTDSSTTWELFAQHCGKISMLFVVLLATFWAFMTAKSFCHVFRSDKMKPVAKTTDTSTIEIKKNTTVRCKGCDKLLSDAQVSYMLDNPKYNEWCREGYCSSACPKRHQNNA